MCLEQLDRIWEAKDPPYANYAELFHKLEHPNILYLALILHDLGKPEGHGHPVLSALKAMRVAKRLGLDGATTHTLRRLIEHHLVLASVSQRRDLDDPAVIRQVAKQAQTPETLAMLTLLTFADSLATSDKLWNGFKDALLWSLYHKTERLMTGGTEFVHTEEMQREVLRLEVERLLPEGLGAEELRAHFVTLPARYYQIHSAREVLDDLLLAHRFMRVQVSEAESALAPVVNWHNEPDRGVNTVKVCTWDRAGLFSRLAGSFSSAGLNILSAQIFTRNDGIVLDTFSITDAKTGGLAGQDQRQKFEQALIKALGGGPVDFSALIERQRCWPIYQAYTGEHIPTQIRFDNEASDTRTLIEIETEDRLGLLFTISQTLSELALDISGQKSPPNAARPLTVSTSAKAMAAASWLPTAARPSKTNSARPSNGSINCEAVMIGSLLPQVFLGPAQRRLSRRGVTIFAYHKIACPPRGTIDPFLYASPSQFDSQLAALRRAGYCPATLTEVQAPETSPSRGPKAVLTFDDGFANVLQNGLALLERHRFHAIEFLVLSLLGGRNEWDLPKGDTPEPIMDVAQVHDWLDAGHQIGSHSMTHRHLGRLSPAEAREEIAASKKALEDRFGLPIRHFCYPYGYWNPALRDLVAEAGYQTACSLIFGVNTPATPRFELRRIYPLSTADLLAKIRHRLARKLR